MTLRHDPDRQQPLAVFDFGKTNAKLFVFDPELHVLGEERVAPVWNEGQLGDAPCRTLDTDALWRWMNEALARALAQWPTIGGVMISTHGCAAGLVGGGELLHPIVDYESELPAAVRAAYDAQAPAFAETLAPHLPGGLNLARQLFWIEHARPDVMTHTEAILTLPQFWSWKLGGRAVSELSSLGCHSQLWAPGERNFSSMVNARGWRERFPLFERAGAVLGEQPGTGLRLHNGVHDSNASLHFYRALGHADCTVVSTGTWVIVFNPGCPIDALDAQRDMLANVTIDGQAVPTARFMGGREYDLITQRARVEVDPRGGCSGRAARPVRTAEFCAWRAVPGPGGPLLPARPPRPNPSARRSARSTSPA